MIMNNIEKASAEWQMSNNPICISGDTFADMALQMNVNPAFIAGAKWMQEKMIEKTVNWIREYCVLYTYDQNRIEANLYLGDLLMDFEKAMKQ